MSLDARKGRILQAIVQDYVETVDPIGSEWLVSHYDFGCKSATIRNEMAEMADLGYLRQPHTSAGRIPSDRGYRYFVDRLMPPPTVARRLSLRKVDATRSTVEELILQTCRILAGMTQYPSIASPPSGRSAVMRRAFLSRASEKHVLVVILLSTGEVEHRVIDSGPNSRVRDLDRAANFLNRAMEGSEVGEITTRSLGLIPTDLAGMSRLIERAYGAIVEVCRAHSQERVLLEGTSQFLRQPEFKDVTRLEQLLTALEEGKALHHVFRRHASEDDVNVVIGEEASIDAMRDCSLVTSSYHIGDRVGGFIGIIGPTRMHYERAVGAVGFMARNLSALLTEQSLA